jgi:N4-gp56 family major capsid protein
LLGEQAASTLDVLCRNVLHAGTGTIQYASTSTSTATVAAGMILNSDEVKQFVRTLEGNNARPITEMVLPGPNFNTVGIRPSYVAFISEDTHFDLKNDPEFVPVEEYASGDRIHDAEVGKIDNVRFLNVTTQGSVSAAGGSGSIDVHRTIIVGRDFYGITRISGHALQTIVKPLGSAGSSDPLNQRSTMGWKASFVAKILNENFGGRIEHAVSS